ncbi:hypothetical protein [Flavobacterium sp. JP2137]|uniref:hypothetical protein n=1 Tax=Flavobacterium sp. JP2137 TaxID=3414510 RepID=UPI003D2FFF68
MKRKSLVSVAVLLLLVVGLGYLWYTSPPKGNTLWVSTDSSLTLDKVVIEKGFYSIHAPTDEELVRSGLEDLVFDGKSVQPLQTTIGENDFLVRYDGGYYALFRHLIPNDFHQGVPQPHKYRFYLERLGERLQATLEVEGSYPLKVTREMRPVSEASKQLWGENRE